MGYISWTTEKRKEHSNQQILNTLCHGVRSRPSEEKGIEILSTCTKIAETVSPECRLFLESKHNVLVSESNY